VAAEAALAAATHRSTSSYDYVTGVGSVREAVEKKAMQRKSSSMLAGFSGGSEFVFQVRRRLLPRACPHPRQRRACARSGTHTHQARHTTLFCMSVACVCARC
jgi:hypothetical protein